MPFFSIFREIQSIQIQCHQTEQNNVNFFSTFIQQKIQFVLKVHVFISILIHILSFFPIITSFRWIHYTECISFRSSELQCDYFCV